MTPPRILTPCLALLAVIALAGCEGTAVGAATDESADTSNLVGDPGFESQTISRGLVAPWTTWVMGTAAEAGTDLAGYSHSGSKSGFVYAASPKDHSWTALAQTVKVQANTHYTLSAYVQSSAGTDGYFGARPTSTSNALNATAIGTLNGYTKLEADFDSGSNTTVEIFAGLWSTAGQSSWIRLDDVSLSAGTTTSPTPPAPPAPPTPPTTGSTIELSPGGNDSANFNSAVARCNGDTIVVNAGTYSMNGLTLGSNCTIKGVGNPVFKSTNPGHAMVVFNNISNLTLNGITFDGGGVYGGSADHLTFTGNTIQNIPWANVDSWNYGGDGIHVYTLTNSTLSGNHCQNLGTNAFAEYPNAGNTSGDPMTNACIGTYLPNNVTIDSNVIESTYEGIKFYETSTAPVTTNNHVTNNRFTQIHRIAIEIQFAGNGVVISGNRMGNWAIPYWGSMCISYATQGTAEIFDNVCDGTGTAGGRAYFGICIENMADAYIHNNLCEVQNPVNPAWTWGTAVANYAWNTPGANVVNNVVCGEHATIQSGNGVTIGQNTSSVSCEGLYQAP